MNLGGSRQNGPPGNFSCPQNTERFKRRSVVSTHRSEEFQVDRLLDCQHPAKFLAHNKCLINTKSSWMVRSNLRGNVWEAWKGFWPVSQTCWTHVLLDFNSMKKNREKSTFKKKILIYQWEPQDHQKPMQDAGRLAAQMSWLHSQERAPVV